MQIPEALICIIYRPLSADHFSELTPKLVGAPFLMVIATIWFGCNNAARDIVGEWTCGQGPNDKLLRQLCSGAATQRHPQNTERPTQPRGSSL